jgi:hypothetical protein
LFGTTIISPDWTFWRQKISDSTCKESGAVMHAGKHWLAKHSLWSAMPDAKQSMPEYSALQFVEMPAEIQFESSMCLRSAL